jgi:membrane dipeptidase
MADPAARVATTAPVIFRHGACRALDDHQPRALAARGGVLGVAVVDDFLGGNSDTATVASHIDHAVQTVGPAHVGLGTDVDGAERVTHGLDDVSRLPNLTAALLERGYRETDLAAILGGDWPRLLEVTAG